MTATGMGASPRVVVVGAKGTLGSRLVRDLAAEGVDFRASDAGGAWREAITRADVVVNVGGPRVRPGLRSHDYFREHVGVAQATLAAMRAGARLIHVSSTAVFGARATTLGPETDTQPELFPMPDYAAAKLAAERYVDAHAADHQVSAVVLRPSMVYGPGVDSALESIDKLAARGVALSLRPLRMRQHLLHVDLFVAAVRACCNRPLVGLVGPLLLADPFVLANRDLVPRARLPVKVPVMLELFGAIRSRLGRARVRSLTLDSLAVLALDNVFVVDATFEQLGLDRTAFDRAATFDRYFAS